jgi:hypothetical protein
MPITLIHPCDERKLSATAAPRVTTLEGKAVALLDISKPGGSILLDRLERLLRERYGVGHIVRVIKATYTKPAPEPLVQDLRGVDAVIEALAD